MRRPSQTSAPGLTPPGAWTSSSARAWPVAAEEAACPQTAWKMQKKAKRKRMTAATWLAIGACGLAFICLSLVGSALRIAPAAATYACLRRQLGERGRTILAGTQVEETVVAA